MNNSPDSYRDCRTIGLIQENMRQLGEVLLLLHSNNYEEGAKAQPRAALALAVVQGKTSNRPYFENNPNDYREK